MSTEPQSGATDEPLLESTQLLFQKRFGTHPKQPLDGWLLDDSDTVALGSCDEAMFRSDPVDSWDTEPSTVTIHDDMGYYQYRSVATTDRIARSVMNTVTVFMQETTDIEMIDDVHNRVWLQTEDDNQPIRIVSDSYQLIVAPLS